MALQKAEIENYKNQLRELGRESAGNRRILSNSITNDLLDNFGNIGTSAKY